MIFTKLHTPLPIRVSSSLRLFSSSSSLSFITKIHPSASSAIAPITPSSTLLCGGFGLSGLPQSLISAIAATPSIHSLTVVSNNAGTDSAGLSALLKTGQISKMVASYIGTNKTLETAYLTGQIELELNPQGTMAERVAAGAKGVPAFYTPAGVGTVVETGELPVRHSPAGKPVEFSKKKESRVFNGRKYLMEEAIFGDVAIIKAEKVDRLGNCTFRLAGMNFNRVFGANAKYTVVEAEEIVEVGDIPPDAVHLPGIYVDAVVKSSDAKMIERRTVAESVEKPREKTAGELKRERIARRAAREFENGMHVNLGIGIPTLAPGFVRDGVEVFLHSENGLSGFGAYPEAGMEDADIINAAKETVTLKPGAATFGSDESFGMIRAGKIDLTVLGAMEVSQNGDLANWMVPGKIKGFGGAVDLVSNPEGTRVVVTMEHEDRKGRPKIVKECGLPVTGRGCVARVITELGVFDVVKGELVLREVAEGVTVEEVRKRTGAEFRVEGEAKEMLQ